jgi:hypothetical protein
MVTPDSHLWQFLSPSQQQLARDGQVLIEDRKKHPNETLSDYSYLVFPYAKLYEGFLKQLFLDIGAIGEREYKSDHFRIGKALSPNLAKLLGERSAYAYLSRHYSDTLAMMMWKTWKQGRNLVFHYFPHNIRRLNFSEAISTVGGIIETMEEAIMQTHAHHTQA